MEDRSHLTKKVNSYLIKERERELTKAATELIKSFVYLIITPKMTFRCLPMWNNSTLKRRFSQFQVSDELQGKFAKHDYERYQKEKLILVDEKNNEVGSANIVECHLTEFIQKQRLAHRAFSVLLFDQEFKLLLQRRAHTKPIFPLYWANSCCSHPQKTIEGEDVAENALGAKRAGARRLMQELGLKVAVDKLQLQGMLHYEAYYDNTFSECEMDYILAAQLQAPAKDVPFDTKEVAECLWVSLEDFDECIADLRQKGQGISPWLVLFQEMGLKDWWNEFKQSGKITDRFQGSPPKITDYRNRPN